jgi:hypothetical protein
MWEQVETGIKSGEEKDPNKMGSSLVMNFKFANSPVRNGFVEVLDGPTGFMCIKREVFTKMEAKYPELNCVNDHQNRDLDEYHACFDCMIDPVSRRYLSEDYAFCRRWQQMGGQIFADVTTTLGHIGNIRFHGTLDARLQATQVSYVV